MGMDLISITGDRFRFNGTAWGKVLDLAARYGWQPAGTLFPNFAPPDYTEITDYLPRTDLDAIATYYSNDGQIVTETDALAIANALEKSLDDIPDYLPDVRKLVPMPNTLMTRLMASLPDIPELQRALAVGVATALWPDDDLNPFEFFGGDEKQKVKDFIAFCRKGEFCIW